MNEMLRLEKQKSQSGQALVEYILILAIAVALILGLINQLYKPFGNWMRDYMGQYLECLLDVGELPTVGGSSDSGECNSKFSTFSVTGGRPPIATTPSTGESSSDKPNSGSKNGSNNTSAGGTSGEGGGSSAAINRGRNGSGSSAFATGARSGSDSPRSEIDGSEKIVEKLPQSQYYRLRSSRNTTIASSNELVGRNGLNQQFITSKKENSSEIQKGAPLPMQEEFGVDRKPKKILVKPTERKVANVEKEESWSMAEYLKYGLIIIIIIAVVMFLGGQILQISKSMEK